MFLAKFENGLSSHCYLLRTIFWYVYNCLKKKCNSFAHGEGLKFAFIYMIGEKGSEVPGNCGLLP